MSIVITIDKSTFQQLNFDELRWLSHYYKHNIPPVLVMEVLGDLKKEFTAGKKPPEARVKDFAMKLFPVETVINQHYKNLIIQDLTTENLNMDGRPVVGIKKAVQSDSGQKGFVIEETEEEKAIYKWKEGFFSDADYTLSSLWRETTTQEDLLINLKDLLQKKSLPRFTTVETLWNYTKEEIMFSKNQEFLLKFIIELYGIPPVAGVEIFGRWALAGMPDIKTFAPYAFHCLSVDSLFLNGLACGLIHTRPTNNVDKEYLYYLPFCNVFTSNDKFHKDIISVFLRSDQKFITGDDLKKDMKEIVERIGTLEADEMKKMLKGPPVNEGSITFNLWREYFEYPDGSQWRNKDKQLDESYFLDKMRELSRAMKGSSIDLESGEEEFVVRLSSLSMNDPCPICGSGKKVVDCCIPFEEFMKLAINEKRQKVKEEIEVSYAKADHVRFSTSRSMGEIVFAYSAKNIDTQGHIGLISNYGDEKLKLTGAINGGHITLTFTELDTGETINLKPLACSPRQVNEFVKKGSAQIAILWGLVDPKEQNNLIIPIKEDGAAPSKIIIKSFELL
ncbi:MAG: SEC-C domain-containing protein [Bacteroidia bacterium]|jgi:hypothetical protein|nr:SEC-C domain-containing protein [Bacteroidia bacterium]